MLPEQTTRSAEGAFREVGIRGLSVWAAADLSAVEVVQLARSHDDPDAKPPLHYLPHGQMRTSTVGRLRARGFGLLPDSPRGHYLLTIRTPPTDEDWSALQEEFGAPEPTTSGQEV